MTVVMKGADGAGVLGTATLQPLGRTAEIVAVAVLPAHRRRGFAAAMTAVLVADAVRRAVNLVFLSAFTPEAEALYLGLGFQRMGQLATTHGPADDVPPGGQPGRRQDSLSLLARAFRSASWDWK